jgi:23S rRNA (cytidine1920-2'-O)/16S rRNA (cytidine1409-2'-O)-methyltransferase
MSGRRRLDAELVRRGLMPSLEPAREAIEIGTVTVNGSIAAKSAHQVLAGDALEVLGPPPRFVSRGGEKLDAALDAFDINVDGRSAIDVGASTGGFTDCLLQRGAVAVIAVDVGRGQMHEKLRADRRVTVMEKTDVRGVDLPPAEIVTVDVSFIGLAAVLPDLLRLARSDLVVLVKPQFEAEREIVSKGKGVITDPDIWIEVLTAVEQQVSRAGLSVRAAMPSPIRGAAGNVEFLLHLHKGGPVMELDVESLVEQAEHLP